MSSCTNEDDMVFPPPNLSHTVHSAFLRARAAGDLSFFPTKTAVIPVPQTSSVFQIRYAPSLAQKPKAIPSPSQTPDTTPAKPRFNPFENPPDALVIAKAPSHTLVLNKFAITPDHFLLITTPFREQTFLLEEGDLGAVWACMTQFRKDSGEDLFVFFNSGPASGASQPHRHLQLLPVSCMREGLVQDGWNVLADKIQSAGLPFQSFSEPLTENTRSADLHASYIRLYKRARAAVQEHHTTMSLGTAGEDDVQIAGATDISYNMAVTANSITICPRLCEGAAILSDENGDLHVDDLPLPSKPPSGRRVVGTVEMNGTLLAGTALVKAEEVFTLLGRRGDLLFEVLRRIGVPKGEK